MAYNYNRRQFLTSLSVGSLAMLTSATHSISGTTRHSNSTQFDSQGQSNSLDWHVGIG